MSRPPNDNPSEARDRRVLELWERLVEIEQRLIPTGLHVFGRAAVGRECADLLRAVASYERPECGARALNDLVSEGLGLDGYEKLLADKSDDGWRVRARVDETLRESIEIFLCDGAERASLSASRERAGRARRLAQGLRAAGRNQRAATHERRVGRPRARAARRVRRARPGR